MQDREGQAQWQAIAIPNHRPGGTSLSTDPQGMDFIRQRVPARLAPMPVQMTPNTSSIPATISQS